MHPDRCRAIWVKMTIPRTRTIAKYPHGKRDTLFYPTQMFDVPHSKHFMFLTYSHFDFSLQVRMLSNQYMYGQAQHGQLRRMVAHDQCLRPITICRFHYDSERGKWDQGWYFKEKIWSDCIKHGHTDFVMILQWGQDDAQYDTYVRGMATCQIIQRSTRCRFH